MAHFCKFFKKSSFSNRSFFVPGEIVTLGIERPINTKVYDVRTDVNYEERSSCRLQTILSYDDFVACFRRCEMRDT